jgi:hypothetical protein
VALLSQQMRAACDGAIQHLVGLRVTVKPEKAQDGASAPSNHVQLCVRRDELIAEQLS